MTSIGNLIENSCIGYVVANLFILRNYRN